MIKTNLYRDHEIWKPIKGYEGLYQVSNNGNIKSVDREIEQQNNGTYYKRTMKGKFIKAGVQNSGYNLVWLSKQNISTALTVHRLVALAFLDEDPIKKFVNHINGIKTDNRVENLEWVTKSENTKHAHDNLPRKSTGKKILCIELNREFSSIQEASNELKINVGSISHVINKRNKTAGNYTWRKI